MDILRQKFAAHGLPSQIVADNRPQFVSQEFAEFMKSREIKHVRSALCHHPASDSFIQAVDEGNSA